MADEGKSKIDEATEKAYAEATATVETKPKAVTKPAAPKVKAEPVAVAPEAKPAAPVAKKVRKAPAKPKIAAKSPAKRAASKKAAPAKKKPAAKIPAKPKSVIKKAAPKKSTFAIKTPTITELKEKIMSKTTKDFTTAVKDIAAEVKTRAKAAYDKGSEMVSEATEFNKANVEAFVESGKILAGAAQEMGREVVEESKAAFETMTADAKKMAAVKSPTELFQLQGELARRNFDAMIAFGSKSTEKMIKLSNDAFAPVSNRMSVAVEKFSKAA